MPKIVNNRKPIKNASYSITEEYFNDFKEAAKLSKNDWRFNKENNLKEIGNKSKMSFVIRYMVRKYVKLRKLETQYGKRYGFSPVEIYNETNTNTHIQEDSGSNQETTSSQVEE